MLTAVLAPVLPHLTHEVAACCAPSLVPRPLEAGWYCDPAWVQVGRCNEAGNETLSPNK